MSAHLLAPLALLCAANTAPPSTAADEVIVVDATLPANVAYRAPSSAEGDDEAGDVVWLVVDDHLSVDDEGGVASTRQLAWRIESAEGLRRHTRVQVEIDPSYQRLVVHRLQIRRGDVVDSSMFRRESFEIVQREALLEQNIVSGERTVLAFLPGAKRGDVIEFAYTILGTHPTMKGRVSERFTLGTHTPVKARSVFVDIAPSIGVAWRAHGPKVPGLFVPSDGAHRFAFDANDVEGVFFEDMAPAWHVAAPYLEVSSFRTWRDVVAWALPLYDATVDDDMRAFVADVVARHPTQHAQVLAIVRFVQDEIRYLGFEMGAGGVTPRPPAVVLARRYGDCKDKSLLMTALLRAIGVKAEPALVHASRGLALDAVLPSPWAFNHVITTFEIDRERYWVDGTWSHQAAASLADLRPPRYSHALVLGEATTGLTRIPEVPLRAPNFVVRERYTLDDVGGAMLSVKTTRLGAAAAQERQHFADYARREIEHRYLNFYARTFDDVAVADPLASREVDGAFLTEESYWLPRFYADGGRSIESWLVRTYLGGPDVVKRKAPLQIAHPVWVRHEIVVDLPKGTAIEEGAQRYEDEVFAFSSSVVFDGRTLRLTYDLRSKVDALDPALTAKHLEMRDAIYGATHFYLSEGRAAPALDPTSSEVDDEGLETLIDAYVRCCLCPTCGATGCAMSGLAGYVVGLLMPR